jgi:transposase
MPNSYRRIEVITGVQRRRRWSAEEKIRIVEESFAPSMTVSAVARRHGINTNQLFLWRRQFRDGVSAFAADRSGDAGEFSFVPLVAMPTGMTNPAAQGAPTPAGMIEVLAAGMTVRVPPGADEATLRCVLDVLRGLV